MLQIIDSGNWELDGQEVCWDLLVDPWVIRSKLALGSNSQKCKYSK